MDLSPSQRDEMSRIIDLAKTHPLDALQRIDAIGLAIKKERIVLLARYMILRSVGFENIGRDGEDATNLIKMHASSLRRLFGEDRIPYCVMALEQVAELDRLFPGALDDMKRDHYAQLFDSLRVAVEKLAPGEVQRILGYTALIFWGSERIKFSEEALREIPDTLLEPILGVGFVIDSIVRSADCVAWNTSESSVDFDLYVDAEPSASPSVGRIRLRADGSFSFSTAAEF